MFDLYEIPNYTSDMGQSKYFILRKKTELGLWEHNVRSTHSNFGGASMDVVKGHGYNLDFVDTFPSEEETLAYLDLLSLLD